MKPKRLVVVVIIGVVLVAGALVFLGTKRSERINELQQQAKTELRYRKADVYYKGSSDDKTYVDGLFEYGLETARRNLGGVFSPPPSEQKYLTAVYQAMIDGAKEKGKTDLARSLHKWVLGQNLLDVKF